MDLHIHIVCLWTELATGNKKRYIPSGVYLFVSFRLSQGSSSLMARLRMGNVSFPVLFVRADNVFKEPGGWVQIL
jgi:hypothetical protein